MRVRSGTIRPTPRSASSRSARTKSEFTPRVYGDSAVQLEQLGSVTPPQETHMDERIGPQAEPPGDDRERSPWAAPADRIPQAPKTPDPGPAMATPAWDATQIDGGAAPQPGSPAGAAAPQWDVAPSQGP